MAAALGASRLTPASFFFFFFLPRCNGKWLLTALQLWDKTALSATYLILFFLAGRGGEGRLLFIMCDRSGAYFPDQTHVPLLFSLTCDDRSDILLWRGRGRGEEGCILVLFCFSPA